MTAFRSGFCCIAEHNRCPRSISIENHEITALCECECHARVDIPVAV